MKRNFIFYAITLVMIMTIGVSCNDDTVQQSTNKVTTSIFGTVLNESREPVADAMIVIDGHSVLSDDYGNFRFNNISIAQDNAFLTATKTGYFKGSRTFQSIENSINTIKIVLLEKSLVGTIDGASGGEVSFDNGAKVELPGNGVSKSDGTTYSGNVSVYARRLDPGEDNFLQYMPGNLAAEDASGAEAVLETYGMLVVELQGASGESLNIKEGSSSTLTIPLEGTIANGAPTTIPLWYFNEDTGVWQEEGSATLVGDKYVGEVGHFSFWNCDAPFPLIELTGTVYENQETLGGVDVKISRTNGDPNRPTGYGSTDVYGEFRANVPANEVLVLEFLNNCGESVSSQTIGPFSADTDLGDFDVNVSSSSTLVMGTAVNCDDQPIANGYVVVNDGVSITSYPILNGNFSFLLLYCNGSTEFEIRVIDAINETESGWLSYPVSNTTVNLGEVIACNEVTEFVRYTINGGQEYLAYTDVGAGTDGPTYMHLSATNQSIQGPEYFNLNLFNGPNIGVGTFLIEGDLQEANGWVDFYISSVDTSYASYSNVTIEFTEYGEIDEFIKGTVIGYIKTIVNDSFYIDGNFSVIRDI
ncbi:MAG: carboxypeptidase-like regulatory domain-containing protein [Chitinophagales bacterium]